MGASNESPGTRVIGRYALYGEIASGGMATVHFGRLLGPVGFSRTVAIKRLHPQFAKDPEFVSMFLDEARVAARIRHPNVVPTLDVVATDAELFLVMEYVQGESLGRLIRAMKAENALPPPPIVASILSGVLHGLHAAHEAKNEHGAPLGIVHRDVSPQNVLVGTDGIARVLDFGVAKATGRLQTTREGQIKGKLAYMPPEQLRGADLSRTTDIYASAVVLWESLTGQRLFHGDNEGAVFTKILEAPVAPPSTIAKGLPAAVDDIVMRGLSREVDKRFATAREMALALEACLPIAPPSTVGAWVEGLAKSVLAQRTTLIAEIESSSAVRLSAIEADQSAPKARSSAAFLEEMRTSAPVPSSFPTAPSAVSTPAGSTRAVGSESSRSQMSSISVAKPGGSLDRETGKRKRAVVAGAVLLGVVVLGVGGWRLVSRPPATAAVLGGEAAPSAAPPTRDSAVGMTSPGAPSASGAPIGSFSPRKPAASSSATASSPATSPTHHPPVRQPQAPRPPTNASSCDPPYTLDSDGNKHYKLNCL